MQLPRSLIKAFAEITGDSSKEFRKETSVRGTAVISNGKKYVRLDSSDILTPISEATDIQNGDRVLVSIENHKATVIGNYTCPASARTASNYMKLIEEGLLVGDLDENGNARGTSSLISPGAYHVVDENGKVVASFAKDQLNFGDLEAIIRFCGGNCRIYSSDGVMVLYGNNAVGMRSAFEEDDDVYRAEVICQAKDDDPKVSIQAYKNGDKDPSHIIVSREGIGLYGPVVAYNGSEIIRTNSLLASGKVEVSGNTLKSGANKTYTFTVNIPEGYHLAGIREIKTNSGHVSIVSYLTHPSTNQVGVRLKNTGPTDISNLLVLIEWFALYTKGQTLDIDDSVLEFEEDDTDGEPIGNGIIITDIRIEEVT